MRTKVKQIVTIRSARFCLGCLFAAAAFAISVLAYGKPKVGLFFAVLFILTGAVKFPEPMFSRRGLTVLYAVWLVLTAFATLFFSQFCLNEILPDQGYFVTFLGTLLILCLFLIAIVFTSKVRASATIVSAILILFSCLNYFVFLFRGSEIAPADILSITAAGDVAAQYSFVIPSVMFYGLCFSFLYYFASYTFPAYIILETKRTRLFSLLSIILCTLLILFGSSQIYTSSFMQEGSVRNGFILNFTLQLKNTFPSRPTSYSKEAVDQITRTFSGKSTEKEADMHDGPDIIVVMNESFADFSVLGDGITVNEPIMPFIDSLKQNTMKGYTLSSIFGGGTPNTEFEFLTGNTLLFLPTGSIPFQQYIKSPTSSLAQDLRSRGYSTVALHQAGRGVWMRGTAWPLIGFDECLFLDDFPQKDIMRGFGTDQEMFETVVSVYENHITVSNSPILMFAVTIQNHGGYDYSKSDFESTIHLSGGRSAYPDVEQYLSCIRETDNAVHWLIDYYDRVDRDVLILFFGDHFPRLSQNFYEEVHGGPFETLDERMLQYTVPFFIWTNYPSESEEIELISMNYLAGLLYQRAGLELPAYNQYLEQLRQTIPACNAFGYYSKSVGGFLPLQEAQGEEKHALWEYSVLEWNCLFDKNNRSEIFFTGQ